MKRPPNSLGGPYLYVKYNITYPNFRMIIMETLLIIFEYFFVDLFYKKLSAYLNKES